MVRNLDALETLQMAVTVAHMELSRQLEPEGYANYFLLVLRRARRQPSEDPIAPLETQRNWLALESLQADLSEIEQSIACLHNVPIYLRRFPYRNLNVSPADYMQYHLENWLSEVYLLRERFDMARKHIKRRFCRHGEPEDIASAADTAFAVLDSAVEDIRVTRGLHVHERRYVDREVLMVKSAEQIVASQPLLGVNFAPGPESDPRRVRRAKAREILEMNAALDVIIDEALAILAGALVNGQSELRLPPPDQHAVADSGRGVGTLPGNPALEVDV